MNWLWWRASSRAASPASGSEGGAIVRPFLPAAPGLAPRDRDRDSHVGRVRDLFSRAVNINPGAWAVEAERPIATLLGSCVAVCLYDDKLGLGGMNHFLLPSRLGGRDEATDILLTGDAAMEVLLNALLGRGARKERLVAKVFGGGTVIAGVRTAIGERNACFAEEWLEREGIPVLAADILGNYSRRLVFDPANGDAFCRRSPVDQASARQIVRQEQAYEARLAKPPAKGRVEIF